jgi:hypothetical protein
MEIFPTWHPDLNKRHFPRSADSEWVSVLAGQRADGVIVPLDISLVDGTTNQYALSVNTEITVPPITIGKVVVQGVDYVGGKHDILATLNPDGSWNMSVSSPSLASEASQLTEIGLIQNLIVSNREGMTNIINALNGLSISVGDIDVNTDELEMLMRLNTATVADGMTLILAAIESSTISIQDGLTDLKIELLEGLTNIVNLVAQQVTQLTDIGALISQQIAQISDVQLRMATEATQLSIWQELQGLCVTIDTTGLAQEVTQLSILQELQGLCVNIDSASLAQEVTQLSILQEIQGLCVNIDSATLNQEVTQLSVLQELQGLSVTVDTTGLNQEVTQLSVLQAVESLSITQAPPHGQYYVFEGTQAAGITTTYDFGNRMQDVYLTTDKDIVVKFNVASNPAVSLKHGTFSFDWQNANRVLVSTTLTTGLQIYANGGS